MFRTCQLVKAIVAKEQILNILNLKVGLDAKLESIS